MNQIVLATFENGVLKPLGPVDLPAGAKVRLIVQPVDPPPLTADQAWEELEKMLDEVTVDSGVHLTRDQLHERS